MCLVLKEVLCTYWDGKVTNKIVIFISFIKLQWVPYIIFLEWIPSLIFCCQLSVMLPTSLCFLLVQTSKKNIWNERCGYGWHKCVAWQKEEVCLYQLVPSVLLELWLWSCRSLYVKVRKQFKVPISQSLMGFKKPWPLYVRKRWSHLPISLEEIWDLISMSSQRMHKKEMEMNCSSISHEKQNCFTFLFANFAL